SAGVRPKFRYLSRYRAVIFGLPGSLNHRRLRSGLCPRSFAIAASLSRSRPKEETTPPVSSAPLDLRAMAGGSGKPRSCTESMPAHRRAPLQPRADGGLALVELALVELALVARS